MMSFIIFIGGKTSEKRKKKRKHFPASALCHWPRTFTAVVRAAVLWCSESLLVISKVLILSSCRATLPRTYICLRVFSLKMILSAMAKSKEKNLIYFFPYSRRKNFEHDFNDLNNPHLSQAMTDDEE